MEVDTEFQALATDTRPASHYPAAYQSSTPSRPLKQIKLP